MMGFQDELFLTFVVGSHRREDIACVLLKVADLQPFY